MFDTAVRAMGNAFTPEMYLFWTRIQCSAWTLADVVIVFYLIRLANAARAALRQRPHIFSYVALAATLPPAGLIPLAPTGALILLIELAVTVPHFLIILYILAKDAPRFAAALHALAGKTNSLSTSGAVSSCCGRVSIPPGLPRRSAPRNDI